jgi:hypothetical protein
MPQNPPVSRSSLPTNVKQLFFEAENAPSSGAEYSPFYYAEVRIDLNDVRTGFRSTVSLHKAISLYLITPDLLWAEDMMRDIDPQRTKSSPPDGAAFKGLPDFVNAGFISQTETQFIHYLLRSHKTKVFRNFELNIYSNAGESASDFSARCSDLLDEPKRRELDVLHEVFGRRLEQIKQKYLKTFASDKLEVAKAESQDKNLFFNYSDRISGLFLNTGINGVAKPNQPHIPGNNPDLEDRLESLELEARQSIAAIVDSYRRKSLSIDEYILHPNLKDIHFVRSCILWIPAGMA